MVENRPALTVLAHATLILGAALMAAPVWLAFVASTYPGADFLSGRLPLWPGPQFIANYRTVLSQGLSNAGAPPVAGMLVNSAIVATLIAVGKIAVSLLSAFAIVYFRFPFRAAAFWIIFMTLMLPVFLRDILLPLSRTNIAALFVILFIYGWNQYLWPLLVTNDQSYYTIVMGIQRMARAADDTPLWHLVMATTMLALLPPVIVVLAMQRLFVKGLVETEK
jgi:sn-glycerol 3-phosphate transport system permease protein